MPLCSHKGFVFAEREIMAKQYELHYLSDAFYKKYDSEHYPEIERKKERPYIVLLIKIEENTFAIPFRTNIKHNYCYKFSKSGRDSESATGLDFTKAVIVNDEKYIGSSATIDDKEYLELNQKYFFIISKFKKYVLGYHDYVAGLSNEFQANKYKYSTLRYFNNELRL